MKSFILFLISAVCFAALPDNTTWEVRNGGNDSNGGGFLAGASGTDYSQQAANHCTSSDFTLAAGTTLATSVSCPFGADSVGNIIRVTAGTNCTVGYYQVVSVSVVTATLDRAAGTTGCVAGTFFIGGAIKTLGQLNTAMGTSNIQQIAWVKADSTYSVGAGITFNFASNSSSTRFPQIRGYTTTRGDNGQPTLQATSTGYPIITVSNNNSLYGLTLANFILDCNNQTNSTGITLSDNYELFQNILAENCKLSGFKLANGFGSGQCIYCYATANSGSGVGIDLGNGNICVFCVSYSNTITGFALAEASCYFCISANNSGGSSDGFSLSNATSTRTNILFSVAYTNGRDGVRITLNSPPAINSIQNSIFYANVGKAIDALSTVPSGGFLLNFNAYQSGSLTGVTAGVNDVTLSADPFTNGAGNVFILNSTAGGGAALKAVGFPGALATGGTGKADIGALQSGTGGVSGNAVSGYVK